MKAATRQADCPAMDNLSDVADGMADERTKTHVELCADCRGVVTAYQRFDRAAQVAANPPQDLADRVSDAVRAHADARRPVDRTGWWVLPGARLAAAVAVTVGALAILLVALTVTSGPSPELAAVPAPPGPAPQYVSNGGPATYGQPNAAVATRAVTTGADVRKGMAETVVPHPLPATVRHVWAVGSEGSSVKHLRQVLPKGRFGQASEDGNTVFTVRMTDSELQKLVDQLSSRQWQLVSPDMPQPSKSRYVSFGGKPVTYKLVLAEQ